ncbi:MAG TPA: SDR family oxidoreductase [Stellaceae bacterium]|jgi:NAD(P)-dependent dehydrogenase (short-subunit alcohol dehydrogenase family)|nr:SDR family oxidoreductase [Stellaceae bacterium]
MDTKQMFDLTGQAALVTGAASGIGLACAEILAESGARVMLTSRHAQTLDPQVARLKQAGLDVDGIVADVTDYAALTGAFDATVARWGKLDICFANAGISGGHGIVSPEGMIENLPLQKYLDVIDINQHGVVHTVQLAAQRMIPNKYGRIVIISSIAGLASELTSYAYSMSKAAIQHLGRMAARQLAPHNIMVNVMAPGPVYTHIGDGALDKFPEGAKRFAGIIPRNRLGQTDELKGLALLLASPAASFIAGAVIPVDGGALTMRVPRPQ